MSQFEHTLFGAWRALGLDAAPRSDGGVTFGCPHCPTLTLPLEVADGVVQCPTCKWIAQGTAWEIAGAARGSKKEPIENAAQIAELLQKAKLDTAVPPAPPVPLYSLQGHTIATAENIMVVQAKIKAGKSAAIGAMLAATMEPRPGGDCLWFSSANPNRQAVLHFDTEQSRYDHYRLIERSVRRAGHQKPPPWFFSYSIKGHSIKTLWSLLELAMEQAAQACAGIHSSMVDGIADLSSDVNDAAEANDIVARLEALAVKYKTLLVGVLHENHGSDSGKTRGHLGSQLARKAETNLRLEKDSDGVTVMFADTSRSVHITKKQAPGFRWDEEKKCHVSVTTSVASMQAAKAQAEMREIAALCFEGTGTAGLSWAELISKIRGMADLGQTAAEKCVRKMCDLFVIAKRENRYFIA